MGKNIIQIKKRTESKCIIDISAKPNMTYDWEIIICSTLFTENYMVFEIREQLCHVYLLIGYFDE